MRWLAALRAAMQRERHNGKAIIVIGDMNMSSRFIDGGWEGTMIDVEQLVGLLRKHPGSTVDGGFPELQTLKRDAEVTLN